MYSIIINTCAYIGYFTDSNNSYETCLQASSGILGMLTNAVPTVTTTVTQTATKTVTAAPEIITQVISGSSHCSCTTAWMAGGLGLIVFIAASGGLGVLGLASINYAYSGSTIAAGLASATSVATATSVPGIIIGSKLVITAKTAAFLGSAGWCSHYFYDWFYSYNFFDASYTKLHINIFG